MRSISIISTLLVALLLTGFSVLNEEYGLAASYDDSFQGSETASKEKYNKNKLTGAHKTLPFGTLVKVTRLDSKQSVKIRINDRGPYLSNRIIEVSRKAAKQIGLDEGKVTRVKIEVVGTARAEDPEPAKAPPVVSKSPEPKPNTTTPVATPNIENPTPDNFDNSVALAEKAAKEKVERTKAAAEKAAKEKAAADKASAAKSAKEKAIKEKAAADKAAKAAAPAATSIDMGVPASRVRGRDFAKYDLYKVQILRPERTGYGVQVASLTDYANVMRQVAELQEKWFNNILISVEEGANKQPVYKIMLGPFPDRTTAKSYEKELKRKKKIDGFIVDLSGVKY